MLFVGDDWAEAHHDGHQRVAGEMAETARFCGIGVLDEALEVVYISDRDAYLLAVSGLVFEERIHSLQVS